MTPTPQTLLPVSPTRRTHLRRPPGGGAWGAGRAAFGHRLRRQCGHASACAWTGAALLLGGLLAPPALAQAPATAFITQAAHVADTADRPGAGLGWGEGAGATGGLLRVPLNGRTAVVWEPARWRPSLPHPADAAAPAPVERLGLDFRATGPADAPRALLRVQLSAQSVLNFRPRGGGMLVTYKSQF